MRSFTTRYNNTILVIVLRTSKRKPSKPNSYLSLFVEFLFQYVGALQYSAPESPHKPFNRNFHRGLGNVSITTLVAAQSTRMFSTSDRDWIGGGRETNKRTNLRALRTGAVGPPHAGPSPLFVPPFMTLPSQTLPPWTKGNAFVGFIR
jgi:hypothetical protein